jgi:hypothetical protein
MLKRRILKLAVAAVTIASALGLTGVAASGGTAYAATTGVKTTWDSTPHTTPPTTIRHNAKSAPANADQYGCDSGWVCIINNNGNIVHAYYTYGAHNIENPYLYGWYFVDNNQTGGAEAALCTGSNGAGCGTYYDAPHSGWADMTPINSVGLRADR